MQKKILSAVLSLFLVGSASSAFAGYWGSSYEVDVYNSFNQANDNDGLDLDVDIADSFNKEKNVSIADSFNKSVDVDVDVTKTYTKQGNFVAGHIVVQQFGAGGSGTGGGDVISVDNSINDSIINSYNDTNSHNFDLDINKTYNKTYTKNVDIDVAIDDSFNVDSFNKSKLSISGGHRRW